MSSQHRSTSVPPRHVPSHVQETPGLNSITNLTENSTGLRCEVDQVKHAVNSLHSQQQEIMQALQLLNSKIVSPPVSQVVSPPSTPTLRSPREVTEAYSDLIKNEHVPTFDGSASKFKEFSTLLLHHLKTSGSLLKCSDVDFVSFGVSKLRGIALEWTANLPESDYVNFDLFYRSLENRFGRSANAGLSARKLLSLTQGRLSINDHIAYFRRLVEEANWNLNTQESRDVLFFSLKEGIQSHLLQNELPKDFTVLSTLASNAENRLLTAPAASKIPQSNSMDVDSTQVSKFQVTKSKKVTKEEKERRQREGLCAYCGDKHSLEKCTTRPQYNNSK
jgi:hypothetical protein